jgi:hypothetical protein
MALPASWHWKYPLLKPLFPTLDFFGLTYNFRFFSPNPPVVDIHLDFLVQFSDGTVANWQYHRKKLAPWDPDNSFQRCVQNYLWWDKQNLIVFPDFARFVAKHSNRPDVHPIAIHFVATEATIGAPAENKHVPDAVHKFTCFSYHVSANDLQ